MTEHIMSIRQARPIPGVAYSQYEVTAQGNTPEELKSNYEAAEAVMIGQLEKQQVICSKDILAKYLNEKSLAPDFIEWLKTNGK